MKERALHTSVKIYLSKENEKREATFHSEKNDPS